MAEKNDRPGGNVTRWDPFADLTPFGSWHPFRDWPRLARMSNDLAERTGGLLNPSIDISESDGAYLITAELPGCNKDDITVELHDGVLTLRGEKRNEREEKGEKRRYVERSYGSFARSFRLPSDAGPQASASFKDGVLTVEVAKAEEAKPRVISIS